MKRIRASFRESATLLLAIAKGEDMIQTDDYMSEDLSTIVKKHEAAERLTTPRCSAVRLTCWHALLTPPCLLGLVVWSLRTWEGPDYPTKVSVRLGSPLCATLR